MMSHKKFFEVLNKTMKDMRNNQNRFGGAMILLAGDFRQTRSTPADEFDEILHFVDKHLLNLSKNMRIELQNDLEKYFQNKLLTLVMVKSV